MWLSKYLNFEKVVSHLTRVHTHIGTSTQLGTFFWRGGYNKIVLAAQTLILN